ncbi:SDR family NAD(P)-dependent oxidoreductase [Nocardia sp. NPDC023852]|uniref:SDR family NAD(P)-dependent oxidoreductase n=1 Tax=Nocardia sp. NPDC023852 TaxID=3154697 RepID=UPI00340F3270
MGTRGLAEGAVLLLGGRSEIGVEVARRLAPGRVVVLAARRSGELGEHSEAIAAAGATAVHRVEFDADDVASHPAMLAKIAAEHGPIGIAVLAFGVLGDQGRAEQDPAHAMAILHTDFVAQAGVLTSLANLLRAQGAGQIVVFSSVAGIRVRRANYVYGSAKAGLDGFASGLADSLHGSGVHLLLVRPGFVIGRMTEGMSPAPFSSTPDQVAAAVVKGLRTRAGRVWVPWILRPVFFAMRLLPQPIWRRMPR